MEVLKETSFGLQSVEIDSAMLANRHIYLTGEISDEMHLYFMHCLQYLETDSQAPVYIHLNSMGGSVYAGLAIYDLIKSSSLEINIICESMALSMGAIILTAGTKGHRFIRKHASVLMHNPSIASVSMKNADDLNIIVANITELQEKLINAVTECTELSYEDVQRIFQESRMLSATEALTLGLCDKIL